MNSQLPRKRNMFIWMDSLAAGFSKKQSRFVPVSSRPFGVWIRRGRDPFWSSSHISAILSLKPPPRSSTLSPKKKVRIKIIEKRNKLGKLTDNLKLVKAYRQTWLSNFGEAKTVPLGSAATSCWPSVQKQISFRQAQQGRHDFSNVLLGFYSTRWRGRVADLAPWWPVSPAAIINSTIFKPTLFRFFFLRLHFLPFAFNLVQPFISLERLTINNRVGSVSWASFQYCSTRGSPSSLMSLTSRLQYAFSLSPRSKTRSIWFLNDR